MAWHPLAEAEFDEAVEYYPFHAGAVTGRKFALVVGDVLKLLAWADGATPSQL